MAIKITAETSQQFEDVLEKLKILNNKDFERDFERVECHAMGWLIFTQSEYMSLDKLQFSHDYNASIKQIRMNVRERIEGENTSYEYQFEVLVDINIENSDQFTCIFRFKSRQPSVEIRAF